MSSSLMYNNDAFVVLQPNQPEQFLSAEELLEKLKAILATRQDRLPRDLERFTSIADQAQHLLDTACDLDLGPGQFLQWYAVRLEKH